MPDVCADACPGTEAVLRLRVINCGTSERTIGVSASDPGVNVSPASLKLGPLQRGQIILSFHVSPTAPEGEVLDTLVLIRGCREHMLRWVVRAVTKATSCSVDREIEDCPDLVHHWYDHFYCPRGCVDSR